MTTVRERDAHLRKSVEDVRSSLGNLKAPTDLVVLPELSSLDYAHQTFEKLVELSEPLDGPSFVAWRKLAIETGVHVCYGFARRDGASFFISAAVVCPEGRLVGYYDKMHLAQFGASSEKDYFTRGSQLFTFDIKSFRLAPIICYDIRFPELSRALVIDHAVDVILHCGAYYRDESFPTWHPFAITRALENQVYLLSLNRAGQNYGHSLFCPPWQDEKTKPVEFEKNTADTRQFLLHRQALLDARQQYTFLCDRLPDYK